MGWQDRFSGTERSLDVREDIRLKNRKVEVAIDNLSQLQTLLVAKAKFKGLLTRSPEELKDDVPHLPFGRVRLGQTLGKGEYARVVAAKVVGEDGTPAPEDVAVKLLLHEQAANPIAVHDIRAEAILLSHLDHPGVLGALHIGTASALVQTPGVNPTARVYGEPSYFIVLPQFRVTVHDDLPKPLGTGFAGGSVCANWAAHKRWTLKRALKLSLQLARALHYLHAEAFAESGDALMHRDLKPQNLGLMGHGEEERLVLCDFGLAALIKTGSSSRAAHAPGYLAPRKPTGPTGSLRYMAPEVALGRMYDESCDVYSFAVVAWQMLSRLTPYFGLGGEAGHRERVVAGGERPALVETWPAPLKQLLARGWAADAGKRPKMAACVAELEKLCAAGP